MIETRERIGDGFTALREKYANRGGAVDVAYWAIRDAIRTGLIRPGERLLEVDLATALQMSRTPVREALRRLEVDRLVENAPRRGLVVPTISLTELIELFEIQEVLEGLAARRAAQRMGPAELEALRATIGRMERARDAGDMIGLTETSAQSHRLVRTGSQHARLPELIYLVTDSHRSRLHEFADPERIPVAVAEHRAIYEALAAHDNEAAENLAREHTRNALRAQILARHLADSI